MRHRHADRTPASLTAAPSYGSTYWVRIAAIASGRLLRLLMPGELPLLHTQELNSQRADEHHILSSVQNPSDGGCM